MPVEHLCDSLYLLFALAWKAWSASAPDAPVEAVAESWFFFCGQELEEERKGP